ncbi:hypothetical protein ACM71K_30525 [Pseudomonas aeruginosa]
MNDDRQRDIELTRQALEDVDAGRVVDHQRVEAWAKSLATDTPVPVPTPARPT